jgi:hypothetical protein
MVSLLLSCEQEVTEGCLDYRYTNFSVSADVQCLDCCKLPEVRIILRHRFSQGDSLNPVNYLTQLYSPSPGDSFFIENLSFILSDFQWISMENKVIPSLDSTTVRTINAQKDSVYYTFLNSFLIGNPELFQKKKVGEIFHDGVGIKGLKFHLGVSSIVNALNPFHFPVNHPLYVTQPYLYQKDKGFIFANIALKWKDQSKNFQDKIFLNGNEYYKVIEIPFSANFRAGYHQEITLEVDYGIWFKHINFLKDSPEMIRQKWLNNLSASFTLVNVVETID